MKVNIQKIDTGSKDVSEVVNQIKEKQLTMFEGKSLFYNASIENDLIEALKKLDIVSSVQCGSISYGPGLGGSYDLGITVYLDFSKMPEIFIQDDGIVLINSYKILERFESNKIELSHEDFEKMAEKSEERLTGDNTYNHSLPVTHDIAFHTLKLGNMLLVSVLLHQGGDARCNYTNEGVFIFDENDYCDFISCMEVGYYNEEYENYSRGYTNETHYRLTKDFCVISVNRENQTIACKEKSSGKEVIFSIDLRLNF